MQTRRDLLQAHRLMTQRAAQALILGEPDNPERPLRRMNIATFAGVMVGVLLVAAWGIWGLLSGGGKISSDQASVVLIAKDTGAKYVWCGGKLCQAVNYASARLAVQGDSASVQTVSMKSLKDFQRGATIGINGAPDSLPAPGQLVRKPWTACARQVSDPSQGTKNPSVSLAIGRQIGGSPVSATVVTAQNENWLLMSGQRMRVAQNALGALGNPQPVAVSPVWMNALPQGVDFKAPDVPGFGAEATGPDGAKARVGQVYHVSATAAGVDRWYVQLQNGIGAISPAQALLLENRSDQTGRQETPLSAADANRAQPSRFPSNGLPYDAPKVQSVSATAPLCAVYSGDANGSVQLTTGGDLPPVADPSSVGKTPGGLDQVIMPPGGAALAGNMTISGQTTSIRTFVLVTDQGRRFPIASTGDVTKLGYDPAKDAVPVPNNFLQMIPPGPTLDSKAAHNSAG